MTRGISDEASMFNPFTSSAATAGYTMAASPVERSSNQCPNCPPCF